MKVLEFDHMGAIYIYLLFFKLCWKKKLIFPCNKITKIDLRGVCQTHP